MKKFYEEYPNNEPIKSSDYIDSTKMSIASINEIVYTEESKTFLGTSNITNGVGIIITNGNNEYALGHFTSDYELSIYSMLNKISFQKPFKIQVIPGSNMSLTGFDAIITFLLNKNNVTLYDFEVEVLNLKHFANESGGIDIAIDTETSTLLKPDYQNLISSRRS